MTQVLKISATEASTLKKWLLDQGEQLDEAPHAQWRLQRPGLCITLYDTGKLVLQGKGVEAFMEFELPPGMLQQTTPPSLSSASPSCAPHFTPHIGNDEAGKGDFFGPLVIAGVAITDATVGRLRSLGVADSKVLSDARSVTLAKQIEAQFPTRVIVLLPERYNAVYAHFRNLNRLLAWAHVRVMEALVQTTGVREVLLDQFARPELVQSVVRQVGLQVHLTQRTKAEEDPVVAAASIVARAKFLEGLHSLSGEVGWSLPKGAGSPVLAAARRMASSCPPSLFAKVAKLHFKTLEQVVGPTRAHELRHAVAPSKPQ